MTGGSSRGSHPQAAALALALALGLALDEAGAGPLTLPK
jgi:hypothetical protein